MSKTNPCRKGLALLPLVLLLVVAYKGRAANYVVAWGDNSYGQADVPPGLTDVIAVAGNNYNSFALRANGTIAAWGADFYGMTNVPPTLTNAIAVSAKAMHALALKNDGTVVAWGSGYNGESAVPGGLTNVVRVAAGAWHSVALKRDGTITGWGYNCCGEINNPAGLTNAVRVAAGNSLTLAIRADGSLLGWGTTLVSPNGPADLTNVVEVAAGDQHVVAVQSNGIVRAWGRGPTNVPPDLTNAISIAASSRHNLAIRADRTLAAWGTNDYGQTRVPPGLTNVLAVAAGATHSLAVVQVNDGSPVVVRHPISAALKSGYPVTLCAAAEGGPAPACQWQWNGQDLAGATNPCLSFPAVCSSNAGAYRAVFRNSQGMATSLEALLTVSNAPPLLLSEPTNQTSYMGAPVTLAVSASGSWPLTYQWRFNGAALAGATNASLVLSSVQLTNEGYYAATVSNAWGTATSSNVFLDVVDLGDALNTSLVWTTSGDAAWFPENQYPSYFTPAARSGSITNNQSSTIQTTATGPGTLTFQWKVSSEPTADHLSFLVNGEEQRRISGQTYWQTETFYLGAGTQTLRWTYAKDGQGSAGQDAAWLDWVGFTQGATVPTITVQPLHQALTPGSNITFSVSAYGTPPLAYQWQCNGVNLAGATSNSLTLFNVQVASRGVYRAVVSNPYGTTISSEASLFTFVGPEQPQDALDRWYWRHPASLARVRFAGGLFIGLGNNGTLLTSPDGAVWTPRVSGTSANLTGVTCGTLKSPSVHPLFVAVGAQGTILTSPDGTNWAPVSVTTQNLNDVAWNGTRFVASTTATAPGQPNILCSTNGTNWLGIVFPNNPDTGIPLVTTSVGIAGNYFITAGGSLFAYYIWRSSNGGTWQNVGFSDQVVEGMASDGSRSIMVGWEGWPRVSADFGASWSAAASSVITSNAYQPPLYASPMVGSDLAFGNDTFVVARGHLNNGFLTTPDGQTWKQRSLFVGADIQSIAYGAGTFVVTCAGGSYPPGIYQSELVATPVISLGLQNPNTLLLNISGEIGRAYRLQSSVDLRSWNVSHAWTHTTSTIQFLEPMATGTSRLFYRVISP